MTLAELRLLCSQSVQAWRDDYAPSMGAALAYYALFSLSPLLLIGLAVAGLVFPGQVASGAVAEQLSGVTGPAGAPAIQALLDTTRDPARSSIAAVVGTLLLLVGAMTVFGELQTALDRIWRVPTRPDEKTWWRLLRARLGAFAMILASGALVLAWLAAGTWLAARGARPGTPALLHGLLQALEIGLGFVLASVLFAVIYKIVPSARIAWRDVWVGALVTAALFSAGKFLIVLYIGRSGVSSAFGAAGSLAALMVWLYWSAQIFLLGAEFTWVYAHRRGSRSGQPP